MQLKLRDCKIQTLDGGGKKRTIELLGLVGHPNPAGKAVV